MRPFRLLVGAASLCVVALTGIYLKDRWDRKAADQANAERALELTRQINLEGQMLHEAIRERRVLLGMTAAEVSMAKGSPSIRRAGDTLSEPARNAGGVEMWVYDAGSTPASVLFGPNGQVIYATELVGKSRLGNEIRANQ